MVKLLHHYIMGSDCLWQHIVGSAEVSVLFFDALKTSKENKKNWEVVRTPLMFWQETENSLMLCLKFNWSFLARKQQRRLDLTYYAHLMETMMWNPIIDNAESCKWHFNELKPRVSDAFVAINLVKTRSSRSFQVISRYTYPGSLSKIIG